MGTMHAIQRGRRQTFTSAIATAALLASQLVVVAPTVQAATNDVRLEVTSARTEPRALGGDGVTAGDDVATYRWMINLDNTGTTEQRAPGDGCSPESPDYPDSCHWTSIAGLASSSPVVAQGDQTTLDDNVALAGLPDGRYLISVLADGYKLDGVHFTVPVPGNLVRLPLQPLPLPTATIKAQVFADTESANGQYDPGEDGLAGFSGRIADYLGQVTTDVFGNPLCTTYETDSNGQPVLDAENSPTVVQIGGKCLSDADGILTIPNLGPNRYALSVVPPTGSSWIQTTTLEGNHDWDAWVMEGATGLDTEFVVAGEPFPATIFGYVPGPSSSYWNDPLHQLTPGGQGTIKGVVDAVDVYVPTTGGLSLPGTIWGGMAGAKVDHQIDKPWIVLSDLGRGDTAVWVGRGDTHGAFTIPNVPDGTYTLTYWDEPQDYILDLLNVTVNGGETVDMGILPLTGWFTDIEGDIFNDTNRNGRRDSGEAGVPNFGLTLRGRANSLMDRGSVATTTDQSGHYVLKQAYPLTEWIVLEAYDDRYYTTGVTYQADNQPEATTIIGQGVDVSVLPIIGLGGRIDWGVHAYDPTGANGIDPQNGGIVGSISYDTTRNELDPQYAAAEDWQPGVSNLPVELYATVPCPGDGTVLCDASGLHALANDGSLARGKLLNTYLSETWQRPTDCTARDVDGAELTYPDRQQVLPPSTGGFGCLEGPLMGVQFGTYPDAQGTADANFGAAVDGNYGFGDGCFNGNLVVDDVAAPVCDGGEFEALPADDYLVHVGNIDDELDDPVYQFTREEDINIGNGDSFVPQVPPPSCAGALHQVDVAGLGDDGYDPTTISDPSGTPVTGLASGGSATSLIDATQAWTTDQWKGADVAITAGTGAGQVRAITASDATSLTVAAWDTVPDATSAYELMLHVPASTPTDNPTFVDIGGSPYEGQAKPLCDTKLVTLQNGKSVVPMFNVFTDVPLPGRFFAYVVDDLNFSSDPKSLLFGEKAGLPFAPVGIYDYANRLVTTVESDYNGLFDVLLPSTNRINCPTPSGVCANLYRFVGNDPGIPGRLNPNYDPQFRTIAAEFEALPGLIVPADNAPTQVGVTIQLPGSQQTQAVSCRLNVPGSPPTTPEFWTADKPFADLGLADQQVTITGQGFGAAQGTGQVTLDGVTVLPITSWNDRQIVAGVPATTPSGPHQLAVRAGNGRTTVNGLTYHVLSAPAGAIPALGVLDDFNRSNANTLGGNWSQVTLFGAASIRTNGSQAFAALLGQAVWNVPSGGFGADQAAAFRFATAPISGSSLILKANGGSSTLPANFIRVRVATGQVVVETTTSAGLGSYTTRGTMPGTFANGDTLTAAARGDGTVTVYKTTAAAVTTTLGSASVPGSQGTGGGRIGISLPTNARVDDFRGGNVTGAGGGPTYRPTIYEVGTGKPYATIQAGLDAAAAQPSKNALVVVYPGTPQGARINPRGAYYENLVISSPVKLQGVGPGGVYPDGTPVTGSIVDGGAFGGDTALADAWRDRMAALTWVGNQDVFEGPAMSVLAQTTTQYGQAYPAAIDGFDIRGADQANFPNNINVIGGGPTGLPANVVTQGGGVYVNAYAHYLQITNNIVQNNSGSYGGGIRVGTPDLPQPDTSQHNDHLRIANNRIIANGGTNLAGGIGLFAGSDAYEVASNDICGNFSAEYGGGMTVYGLSPAGRIHDNRIYFNRSFDEGGGIMIAGELPVDPNILSPGSGAVDIAANVIQANLANDDGGGLRFLMAGASPMNVVNNIIANNISTHEGGGIAIDDAPNVRIVNDTIVKNITTATAATSDGSMAPAGVSTGANSTALQATLPQGSPTFSRPLMFNDILWDNRAGTRSLGTVVGIGIAGDASPIVRWDIGAADGSGLVTPTNSMLQVTLGTAPDPSNQVGVDPTFVDTYDTSVALLPWRTNPNLIGAIMVATDVPPTLMGDYHIPTTSPANDAPNSVASVGAIAAPAVDIDGGARPTGARFDLGADELPGVAVVAFPRTGLLDQFGRANGALGSNWDGDTGQSTYRISSNQVQVRASGTVWWSAGQQFGANQEAYLKITKFGAAATQQGLLLKAKSPGQNKSSYVKVVYAGGGQVQVWTKTANNAPVLRATFAAPLVVNDSLGARAESDGTVTVYRNGIAVGSTNVASGANPWPAALVGAGGRIGVTFNGTTSANDATFDDFGGGTRP